MTVLLRRQRRGAGSVGVLLALTLPTLVLGEPWEDCRAEMTSACLADLAVTDDKIGPAPRISLVIWNFC